LEDALSVLSVENPSIYDAYIEMLRIINSIPRNKMVWVINLIAALTYQRWGDLQRNQKQTYLEILSDDFISAFNDNELITILLQSDNSELILTGSYLYPIVKMLFIVFGYSKLVPIVTDSCNESNQEIRKDRVRKHLEKYKGASYRRGDARDMMIYEDDPQMNSQMNSQMNPQMNPTQWSERYIDERGNPMRVVNRNIVIDGDKDGYDPLLSDGEEILEVYHADPEPIDQSIYDYIKLFGDLYPTLIGLMGGTESFPPEAIEIGCNDIPPTYDYLATVPEYLWRFNDYSYCRYLEYISSRQLGYALSAKVNSKARYLHSV
jgi:hypothetical protein